jgi:hypothetical protein
MRRSKPAERAGAGRQITAFLFKSGNIESTKLLLKIDPQYARYFKTAPINLDVELEVLKIQ